MYSQIPEENDDRLMVYKLVYANLNRTTLKGRRLRNVHRENVKSLQGDL